MVETAAAALRQIKKSAGITLLALCALPLWSAGAEEVERIDAPVLEVMDTNVPSRADIYKQEALFTPSTVSLIDRTTLRTYNSNSLYDLQFAIPGLVFYGTGASSSLSFRGINNTVPKFNEPAVSFFIDGQNQRPAMSIWNHVADLSQAEALHGVESLLHGFNSTGGAIKFWSFSPDERETRRIALTMSSFSSVRAQGRISGGSERSSSSLSFDVLERGRGVRTNLDNKRELEDAEAQSMRNTSLFISESGLSEVTVRAGITAQKTPTAYAYRRSGSRLLNASSREYEGLDAFGLVDSVESERISQNAAPVRTMRGWDFSLDWRRLTDFFTFQWISTTQTSRMDHSGDAEGAQKSGQSQGGGLYNGYGGTVIEGYEDDPGMSNGVALLTDTLRRYYENSHEAYKTDLGRSASAREAAITRYVTDKLTPEAVGPGRGGRGAEVDYLLEQSDTSVVQHSQEMRVHSNESETFQYVIGLLYTLTTNEYSDLYHLRVGRSSFSHSTDMAYSSRRSSFYAQGTWHITPKMAVNLGGRSARDSLKLQNHQITAIDDVEQCAAAVNAGAKDIRRSNSWSRSQGQVGFQIRATKQLFIYQASSRGYKTGGYNPSSCYDYYEPEEVTSHELGLKFRSDRIRMTVSAYQTNLINYQTVDYVSFLPEVNNQYKGESNGVDFRFLANLAPNWVFQYGYAQNDSKITGLMNRNLPSAHDPATGRAVDIIGNALPLAPKEVHQISIDFTWVAGDSMVGVVSMRNTRNDGYYFSVYNDEFNRQDGYSMTDLHLRFAPKSAESAQMWTFGAFVKNMENESVLMSSERNPLLRANIVSYGAPTTAGITLSREW
ncbi:MAG: TonB-dependent receptor [Gammaproteobacteria bacterium AqS3]|nr:TonB-dependent receptor [Gammaproteobacteria bacterium AqS3]